MENILKNPEHILNKIDINSLAEAIIILAIGLIIALLISSLFSKAISKHASRHYTLVIRRLLYYGTLLITLIIAISTSRIDVAAWGAALTLAIGFAARTPISNVISGLFLVIEKPFVIGDEIKINNEVGEIISIDLLSVKVRTRDNNLIRWPNELMIQTQFRNLSRFEIIRVDIPFYVQFQQNLDVIEKALMEIVEQHENVLVNPSPFLANLSFTYHGTQVIFSFWCPSKEHLILKHEIGLEMHQAFIDHQIKFP